MKKRLLFVDDELKTGPVESMESIRNYLDYYVLEFLDSGLFTIDGADGADSALDLLASQNFDLVIVDVMIPESEKLRQETGNAGDGVWTGITLARDIHQKKPNLPIIILSNMAGEASNRNSSVFEELRREGVVQDVLFKLDNRPEDVLNTVNRILTEEVEAKP